MIHQHTMKPSEHEGYEVCTGCGSYHSTVLWEQSQLYENNYWSQNNNRASLKWQVYNHMNEGIAAETKIQSILKHINERGNNILEIGCAPGILMKKLYERGNYVWGMEPDKKNIKGIQKICGKGPEIIEGYFPGDLKTEGRRYGYIIAMDVVEHIEPYEIFFANVYARLKPNGMFIFMSPILLDDGKFREIDFIANEHAWIFTQQHLINNLIELQGFRQVNLSRWIVGHEICIAQK